MKKEVLFGFVLLLLLAGMPILSPQAKVSNDVNASLEKSKQEIVTIEISKNNKNLGIQSLSNSKNNTKSKIWNISGSKGHDFGKTITANISKNELEKIKEIPEVKSINKPGTKKIFLQDSTKLTNASKSWKVDSFSGHNLTGKGESVAVLDTGLDTDHPDIKGENATCVIDCVGNSCNEDCSVGDPNGHGTHVSGIVTSNGKLKGVAPQSKVVPIRVCNATGSCLDPYIKDGLEWAIENREKYNISAISMSLGSGSYKGYCDDFSDGDGTGNYDNVNITGSINEATNNNLSVIVSTGNNGETNKISNPACVKSAVPVGSTNDLDMSEYNYNLSNTCTDSSDKKDEISCFSNRNNITNLMAPGSIINSTYRQNSYSSLEGTSMAAPHVAAAFAIINQYKELESSKILETQTIEESLNDSGKRITDSGGSGLTFSRIDIFGSLLDLDEKAPNITSVSPNNESVKKPGKITTSCNVSDELQLKNSTIKIWNSGSLRNKSVENASNNSLENNLTANLSSGQYSWNCITYDEKGNKNTLDSNYTLNIQNISSNLESPSDNKHTNTNSTNFSCSGETFVENSSLENSTFKVWNSSGLEYNETANISGTSNTTNYSYTLEKEGGYEWNCEFSNNRSDSTLASSNNSITYDSTKPNVTLISPNDGKSKSGGSQTVDFDYNVSEKNLEKCSLLVDNSTEKTNSSVNTSITNTFSKSLSSGSYSWKVSCTDLAGNSKNSSSRSLTIESSSNNNGGSGGGGGGSSGGGSNNNEEENNETENNQTEQNETEGKTENISQSEMDKGVSKSLGKGDKVEFDVKSSSHSMEVNEVSSSDAEITIRSDPINLSLKVNESEKVNFDSDGFLDLKVKLNSIEDENANFTLKEINESIGSKSLHQDSGFERNNPQADGSKNESEMKKGQSKKSIGSPVYYILGGVLVLFIVALMVYFKFKKKPKEILETLKSYND